MTNPPTRDVKRAEAAVLDVLAGTPIEDAARRARIPTSRLAEDIARYRAAGRAALESRVREWHQVNVRFADYPTAHRAVRAHLLPSLRTGPVGTWWFVRKHPNWRFRFHPVSCATTKDMAIHLADALDRATSRGAVQDWRPGRYEPETFAFGGDVGMDIAHDLFHVDSIGTLDYLHRAADSSQVPAANVASLLAMTVLMRAAHLEFGEQGDVWGQVERHRPLETDLDLGTVRTMIEPMGRLLLTDARPLLTDGPLTPLRPWFEGLERCGRLLAQASSDCRLSPGLRRVLARHVLFHWNRMGFTARQQAIWSHAAREAVLGS
ncbi:thiopeptide-type bacteriocin biosynthesis protein [Actinacidiphila yeochonensis]|uniref:thiopeptide-type bacteriocin biosynthesis protein n=1 Tax=Actinacidiphila yeochonensis TaxID=89050 RepID=UPI00068A9231|nr:thiopeptide-type bacteriocin biosynthesis protein [Actinacidiphila yeochonensis]